MVAVDIMKYRFLHLRHDPLWLLVLCLCLPFQQAMAQDLEPLEVSQTKAVHLIFPSKVTYCDAGNKDVKFTVTNNIVKLIAAKAGFAETNLTIITEDSFLYSYLLLFSKNPRRLTLQPQPRSGQKIGTAGAAKAGPTAAAGVVEAAQPQSATATTAGSGGASTIPDAPPGAVVQGDHARFSEKIVRAWTHTNHHDTQQQLQLQLRNIYQRGDFLYFTLMLENKGSKDVLINFVNFQQAQRQGVLQRLYREALKKPLHIYNKQDKVPANGQMLMVYAFDKFSIEKGKMLLIEVGEKEGDRFLSIPLNAELINEATVHQ